MTKHRTDDNDEAFQELLDGLNPVWPKEDEDEND